MLRWLGILSLVSASCVPVSSVTQSNTAAVAADQPAAPPGLPLSTELEQPAAVVTPPPIPQSKLPLRYHNTTRDGIRMYLVSFDDRDHLLVVADQAGGAGSRWTTAQQAASSRGGVAAINGGFFTPEGKPLGIVIESGNRRGSWNRSSLGAAIYIHSAEKSAILRSETYQKARQNWRPDHLLQTGPMLAEGGGKVSGLSKTNRRPRSFIAWDGKHHWAIGYAEACTLAELSGALANRTPAGFEIKTAVNLDGGRSSDLWASARVPNGGKTHRGFFNKPVRNYLVLKAR